MADTLFKYSAIKCGIKYQDKLDFALISSSIPCNCSALFTTNVLKAAPVLLSKDRFNKPVQAIVVNSSNANACTGDQGYANAVKLTSKAAQSLSIKEDAVLNASTGVIGVQLPIEKMISKVDELTAGLSPDKQETFAKAIMTTDTVHKYVRKTFTTADGKEYFIEGFAKGAGMIAPNMATLLSFIMTDAPIAKDKLDVLFREAINISYNAITIDGDMSTNDSAYILSPALPPLVSEDDIAAFSQTLTSLLKELAKMLVEDGEGATKCVTVHVKGCAKKRRSKKNCQNNSRVNAGKNCYFR
jgi:glutamate N-acetyltransferase/amino-acid N-acetyltransferase